MSSTDVARSGSGASSDAVVIPETETFRRFLAAADDGEFDQNPEQVAVDIIAKILEATTAEQVLGREDVIHARDYLDVPFMLTGVKFNKGDFDSEAGKFYALLEGADRNGEKLLVTCGAKQVIAQAWKLRDLDALPTHVVLKQSTHPTSSGFYVIWMEGAGAPF